MMDRTIRGLNDRSRDITPLYPSPHWRSVLVDCDFVESTTPFTLGSAGAGAISTLTGGIGVPGFLRLGTGTTATGRGSAATTQTAMTLDENCSYEFRARVRVLTLSTGAEQFVFRIGFGDSNSADFTDGVYFELDSFVDANWLFKTAKAGARTSVTGTVAAVANQLHDLWIRGTKDSISGYVDGSLIGTISTNMPTASTELFAAAQVMLLKSVGTTDRQVNIDYITSVVNFDVPRGSVYAGY